MASASSASAEGSAQSRVALVIGNGSYAALSPLPNPANDADDIATALISMGFDVTKGKDLSKEQFKSAVRAFYSKLDQAQVALLFYAGHGMQAANTNYLIPIDAKISSAPDVVFDAVALQDIISFMEQRSSNVIVILDACRDNPFGVEGRQAGRAMQLDSGLAAIGGSAGTYIAFAAEPGLPSYDGTGRNSQFTRALLRYIATPDIDVRLMMSKVRKDVIEGTAGRQTPWENSSLTTTVSLNPVSHPSADTENEEAAAWAKIVESTDAANFSEFLQKFPNGVFASTAKMQVRRLTEERSAGGQTAGLILVPDPQDSAKSILPTVISVQKELIRIGCLAGQADGVWGGRSRRALGAYEFRKDNFESLTSPDKSLLDRLSSANKTCSMRCDDEAKRLGLVCLGPADCALGLVRSPAGSCNTQVKKNVPSGTVAKSKPSKLRTRPPSRQNKACFGLDGKLVCG